MITSRWIFIITLLLVTRAAAQAQQYYVVTGVFAIESNAQKFTGYMRMQLYNAAYDLNVKNNYFYVYVLNSNDHAAALSKTQELQQGTEFKEAWLFKGKLGIAKPVATEPIKPEVVEVTTTPVAATIEEPTIVMRDSSVIETIVDSSLVVAAAEPEMKIRGKLCEFIVKTSDGKVIKSEIHQVDYQRSRDLGTFQTNQYIDLVNVDRQNPMMTLVCGVFGYKEAIRVLDYSNPAATPGVTQDDKGAWLIPYELQRMKKGDVSVMYHVSFYKDAVVMLPPSKAELDELVNMMTDNPNYKIKIHAHCNGENSRRIIALGSTKNYFNIIGSDERNGSAKQLTELRAEAVQNYLQEHGIDKKRTDTYAWGALNMLVSETSTSARLNDRIEIEIMQD